MTLYCYAKLLVREPKAVTSSGGAGRDGTQRARVQSSKDR